MIAHWVISYCAVVKGLDFSIFTKDVPRLLQPAADSPSSAQGHGMGEGVALQMLLYRSLYRLLSWQSKHDGHSNVI